MTALDAMFSLGQFIVLFQTTETRVLEIIQHMTCADDEYVSALVAELKYSSRLRAADVVYSRYVEITQDADLSSKDRFHKLMVELGRLGERRNDLIHSNYSHLVTIDTTEGLVRENRKLRPSKGIQEYKSEDLLPGALDADIAGLNAALKQLEEFRLKVIEWNHPI